MEDVWSWLTTLASPSEWPPSSSPSLPLAVSSDEKKSISLSVDRTAGSDSEALLTFSISLHGFHPTAQSRTIWFSNLIAPSYPCLPLLLQLLQESIYLSPSPTSFSCSASCPSIKLDEESVSVALLQDGQAPAFLSLALLLRLFWLCATDAPAEAGFLFFRELNTPLERALDCRLSLRAFLLAVGPDVEERFMRSLGYMLSKWCLLRELQQGGGGRRLLSAGCCPSYAAERHGLCILKGFAPVQAIDRFGASGTTGSELDAQDSVLRYALAHQQLEAVVQLEFEVSMRDPRFIRICVRVDNLRLRVVRLRFGKRKDGENGAGDTGGDDDDVEAERHFPSRVRVWVGPEFGSAYATGPSLGRSTGNPERELETTRAVKGRIGGGKAAGLKTAARMASRASGRSWRWEQEAEGSAGVFEGVLCDGATGAEVVSWKPPTGGGGAGGDPRGGMRRRYSGWGRAFSKTGGVVVAGDELPEAVEWRVGREMEGRVVKWRVGGRVWVTYFANEVKSGYFETRCVEWREEVELPLVAAS